MKKNMHKGGNNNLSITNGTESSTIGSTNAISNANINNKTMPIPIKRLPYDVKIFSFLCILGILIRMIFAKVPTDYATATVYGYSFSILALFGLLISSFAIFYKSQFSQGIMGFFKVILKNAIPVILTIVSLTLILAQSIYYYDRINSGKVATEYFQYSGISSLLILVEVGVVIKFIIDFLGSVNNPKNPNKEGIMAALASEMFSLILILFVANLALTGILQVILQFFSTDG